MTPENDWKCKSCQDGSHDVCDVFQVTLGNVSYCTCDCNKKKDNLPR